MNEMNNQQNSGKINDEIDLFEFSYRIWNEFKNFLTVVRDFFTSIIIFLIRKSLWIVSFAIVGIICGYTVYNLSKQSYSSLLEGFTGCLDNGKVINQINKLSKLSDNPDLLADFLNLTVEQAEEVKSVNAYYGIKINGSNKTDFIDFDKKYNPLDTNQMRVPSYIYIQVSVYDKNVIPALRLGLLDYVKSNTYINEMFRVCRAHQQQIINQIDFEIQMIDSLQKFRLRRDIQPNTQLVLMTMEPEFKLFHEEKLDLLSRKQQLEKELEVSEEIITIIHDFTPLALEDNPKSIYLMICGSVMAVIGIFSALLWQYRKRIWRLIIEN